MSIAIMGVCLVVQPSFLFGNCSLNRATSRTYDAGVVCALAAAVIGAAMIVCVRASRECHWATVDHVSAASAAFVLTPLGLIAQYVVGTAPSNASSTPSTLTQAFSTLPPASKVYAKAPIILLISLIAFH